jgi:hypothetical protein
LRALGQGRRPHAQGRCRASRFRSRHQLAGPGREIVQGGRRETGADTATVAVTIEVTRDARANAADKTIRYDFVHEAGQWKIDDIKGRLTAALVGPRLLAASLKS